MRLDPQSRSDSSEEDQLHFVGHDESGKNVAGLFSLVATCEANGVNPSEYIADILLRVQTHPASRIDELLPHNWTPPSNRPSG